MEKFFFEEMWIVEIVLGFTILLLVHFGLKILIRYFRKHFFSNFPDWWKKIDHIVELPLKFLLGILGFSYINDVVGHRFGFMAALNYVAPLRNTAIVICISWIFLRWKKEAEKSRYNKLIDSHMAQILSKFISAIILVITAMIILQVLGLNIVPLLAFSGIGAAAVALAGKDVIANWFGGLVLFIQRPFKIGDLIFLSEKNVEGVVEEIGWYATALRDKEKRPLYLPNALFSSLIVINMSRMSHRRIYETIRLRFEDISLISAITEEIKRTLLTIPTIDANVPMTVSLFSFGEYYLHLLIDVYSLETRHDKFLAVKQEVLLLVHEIVTNHAASLAVESLSLATTSIGSSPDLL